jgi:circadian clock protein KaiC
MASKLKKQNSNSLSKKVKTGIAGFDEITNGGIPKNRPTILLGNTGCGKTVMSMEFLIHGARNYGESGVFMTFEETIPELTSDMETFHFNLQALIKTKQLYVDYLDLDKSQIIEAGQYNLDGLFVRLQQAIKVNNAKRIVLDSLDALFYRFDDNVMRHEINRLFKWLKEKKITAIITSEIENGYFVKNGIEQYVADCVIALDNRVINQTTTRRLRIIKMRGSSHGINEYPFIINEKGISVLPLMSELANQNQSSTRISSGIKGLDDMLNGKGFFEGSSILVSGSAGTGKTSVAVSFINSISKKNIPGLYCAFEESVSQITRNMRSIGFNIEPHIKSGILKVYSSRPTIQNLELHLISIQKLIEEFNPKVIVLDPITNLMSEGVNSEIRQMLANFVDYLKGRNITTLFTAAITLESIKNSVSDEGISAMMDTWILLREIESNSERNRGIYVLKSRGMNHSAQVREFVITENGIDLLAIYTSSEGILTGTAKLRNIQNEKEKNKLSQQGLEHERIKIEIKRKIMEEKIDQLEKKFESEVQTLKQSIIDNDLREKTTEANDLEIITQRSRIGSSGGISKNGTK